MSNKTYDFWKRVSRYALPAIGTFYFAISKIWNLPYGEEVAGTVTALVTAINTVLGISSSKYYSETGEQNDN